MNETLQDILQSREDISDYVFHFCKKHNAKETLEKILSENKIRDISDKGYICFSESPITMLSPMFEIFTKYHDPLYAPFGIGIKKDVLFSIGGRHVIYGDDNDFALLDKSIQWRFVKYTPQSYDFSWLREWRINVKEIDLSKINNNSIVVIVDTNQNIIDLEDYLLDLVDMEIDAEPDDGGCTTSYTGVFERKLKVISMEDIKKTNNCSKEDISQMIEEQQDYKRYYLGSKWE